MAASKKARRIANHEENREANSSDSENGSDQEMETIEVDFEVKIPENTDFNGIKSLLCQLFLTEDIDISELADLLIAQDNITGVIKESEEEMEIDDDMDVNFGVFSIVNLTTKKNMGCIEQICSYLLNNCKKISSNEQYEHFKKIMEEPAKHVGLIISERFINIPAKIAVPLYANLSNDMKKATEKKEAYDFEYYILISKMLTFKNGDPDLYVNPEEELIAEEASFSFDFEIKSGLDDVQPKGGWTDEDIEGIPKRRILLLPRSKWDIMYNKLVAELGEYAQ